MPVTVSRGGKITAADINTIVADINSMLTTYGLTADAPTVSPGKGIFSSFIDTLKSKLVLANNSPKNRSPSDLSGITEYNIGAKIFASLLNLIDQKALEIKSNYCSCNCNYCTCNCDYCTCVCDYCTCLCNYCTCNCAYSCTCNCNYACTCNCNYCTCVCNYCTCNCNYACTCNCNYACTCNCNYCTCDCNYACTCNCNYACTCNCAYACTCNCNYCYCDCDYCTCNCNFWGCSCDCAVANLTRPDLESQKPKDNPATQTGKPDKEE